MGIELQKTKSWVDEIDFENKVSELKNITIKDLKLNLSVLNVIPNHTVYPVWVVNDMRKQQKRFHKLRTIDLVLEDYNILRVNLRSYSGGKYYADVHYVTPINSIDIEIEDFLTQINFNYQIEQ